MSIKKSFIVLRRFIVNRLILIIRKRSDISKMIFQILMKKNEKKWEVFEYFDKFNIKKYCDKGKS